VRKISDDVMQTSSLDDDVDVWGPSLEFASPILKSEFESEDDVGSGNGLAMFEVGEEGYCLIESSRDLGEAVEK
jgi:hypothetical protein